MLNVGLLLKSGDVTRRKLHRTKKPVRYWRGNLASFGRHRAPKLHFVEVNHDAIAVITASHPKAFGPYLAKDRSAHHQKAKRHCGEPRRNAFCTYGNNLHYILL